MADPLNLNLAENLYYGDTLAERLYYGTVYLYPPITGQTILWLRGDDFTDSSPENKTPVINGTTGITIDNTEFKYGTGSFLIPASEGWFSFGNDLDFDFGATDEMGIDFTIEFWMKESSRTNDGYWCYSDSEIPATTGALILRDGQLRNGGALLVSYTNPPLNQWNHYAVCRSLSGTKTEVFINGVSQGITQPTEFTDTTPFFIFGAYFSSAFCADANVESIRVTRGQCLYTSDFDPETDPGLAY